MLSLERSEQRAYLENLWQFNHDRAVSASPNKSALYTIHKTIGLMRRFNQLPCTLETRQARADLLAGEDPATCRILVLGDDDLLSVELARRGFQRVTVADCDERLLARIRQETSSLRTPPEVIMADFREGFQWPGVADYVFLDPPYTVAGAQGFLRLAVSVASPEAKLFLMINPFVLGHHFSQVTAAAGQAGFRLIKQRPSFNAYPIGLLEGTILKLAWRLFQGVPVATNSKNLYFCSDCFEFARS